MRLGRHFFNRDTNIVAQKLLGKTIVVREKNGDEAKATIAETEAYHGFEDKASHASCKKTERNKVMFDKAGLVYVYLIYGMHHCINFVTMPKGFPAAVLIRSIAVDDSKIKNQNVKSRFKIKKIKNLTLIEGPGRVTKYLGIDKTFYGEDLIKSKKIRVENGMEIKKDDIMSSKRIGVDYAGECAKWEWNYKIKFL